MFAANAWLCQSGCGSTARACSLCCIKPTIIWSKSSAFHLPLKPKLSGWVLVTDAPHGPVLMVSCYKMTISNWHAFNLRAFMCSDRRTNPDMVGRFVQSEHSLHIVTQKVDTRGSYTDVEPADCCWSYLWLIPTCLSHLGMFPRAGQLGHE